MQKQKMIRGRSYGPGLPVFGGNFLRRFRTFTLYRLVIRTFMWFRLLLFGGFMVSLTYLVSQVRES